MKSSNTWTKIITFVAAGLASALIASAAQPTAASVKELLQLSGSARGIAMLKGRFSNFEKGGIQQALKGHDITPGVRKILEGNAADSSAIIDAALDWKKVEPLFVKIYQANLTQDEVNGIVAFYKTPAGKAMVKKMPTLMQRGCRITPSSAD